MSDILTVTLILVGRLIETGFTVNYRIPSQPKEDGFCLKTVPLYGGTITTPNGKTIIVMKYAQLTCCLPLPSTIRTSTPILTPHATSEKLCCLCTTLREKERILYTTVFLLPLSATHGAIMGYMSSDHAICEDSGSAVWKESGIMMWAAEKNHELFPGWEGGREVVGWRI